MTDTQASYATLNVDEARRLIGAYPQLAAHPGAPDPVLAVLAAHDERELAAVTGVVAAALAAFRTGRTSADVIMRTLLPADRLTVGPGVTAQVHREAELRAALAEEFALHTGAEVAERAGSRATNPRALASRWRADGRILAVQVEQTLRFPGFQFDVDGQPLPVIADVVTALGERLTSWELALWFTASNAWLSGERPVDVLDDSSAEVANAAASLAAELRAEASRSDEVSTPAAGGA